MYRCLLSVFLLVWLPARASAQFIFQNLKREDGLSEKQIQCLYKDSEGYLWIGSTNGLNRFDGALIKQYPNLREVNKLCINAIQPIRDDNYLLLGTKTGIRIFNKNTGIFIQDKRFSLLAKETIEAIRTDDRNRFWIVCTSRIYIFDKGRLYPAESLIPSLRIVQNPEFFYAGFVWDSMRKGFWVGGRKTYFINCRNNQVYYREKNPHHYPLLNSTSVEAIALDRRYNVWYGCNSDQTLNFWDHRTNGVEKFYELGGKRISEGYNSLFVDRQNRLWISTRAFAAYIKEPGKEIMKIPYSQDQNYSIAYGHFRDVLEDVEGNVWLGTINGVSKSRPNASIREIFQIPSFDFFLENGFAQINYISVDSDIIMACKEEGIVAYNMTTGKYRRYVVTLNSEELFRNRFFCSVKSNGRWWFAGMDGVYYIDQATDSLVRFEDVNKKSVFRHANFVFNDAKGNIWFHIWNDALYRYNPATDHCDRFDGKDQNHGIFSYRRVQSFLKLPNNDILFALDGLGFLKFNAQTEQFFEIRVINAKNFNVKSMVSDKENSIWAAVSNRGLMRLNTAGLFIDSLTTGQGLLPGQIASIGIDQQGMIWAASREGLEFINPVTKKETRVEIDLGKTFQDYWNYITVLHGVVYAAMLDHIVLIDPSRFEAIPVKKPPHITSIKIFQNEKSDFEVDKPLKLEAHEDYITFQYASLSHRDVPALQYSYQLEGVDEYWVSAGRTLSASYNNLAHGHYRFRVRSTDEHGKWMNDITSIRVFVKPHWWQSFWAILLYCIMLGIVVLAMYQNNQRRRKKQVIENVIDYFANSVYGENTVNEICWDITRNCVSQLQFEDCVVYLLDKDRNMLVQKASYGPKNPKGHEISNPIEIQPGKGIVGSVALTGKPLIIPDTSMDPRYIIDDAFRLSEIAVPILHEGKVIGVIDSEHSRRNFFHEEHLKTLSTIASISANKIAEAIAEAQAQEKEIKLLEINKTLAESQLMALRAQMNPHFIFNCLNSIQECIVTEKYTEASKYLIKFSKLFRMILNNSGRNMVTIQEEHEMLDLYLQLEQMRFEKSFSYSITVDDQIDPEDTLLPSMLVQPFVENALWHGLMHSSGERRIDIGFRLIQNDVLECRIDDSGIGRKKSFELKSGNSRMNRHESKGLLISEKRLQLLQRQNQHARMQIIDKYNTDGVATGTLVIIELSAFLENY